MKNVIIGVVVLGVALLAWMVYDKKMEGKKAAAENPTAGELADAPEGVDLAPLPSDSLAGTWKSVDDPKFVRTIYENGGYSDTYEGSPDASTNGPWVTFTAADAPSEVPFTVEEGANYLQLDGGEEVLFFNVVTLTEDTLELVYLNRGGVLRFERI